MKGTGGKVVSGNYSILKHFLRSGILNSLVLSMHICGPLVIPSIFN